MGMSHASVTEAQEVPEMSSPLGLTLWGGTTTFVLVKRRVVSSSDAHFAGGKHAFLCMARTLAQQGADVHVVCAVKSAELMVAAAMQGFLGQLMQSHGSGWTQARQAGLGARVVSWRQDGVMFHGVLEDEETGRLQAVLRRSGQTDEDGQAGSSSSSSSPAGATRLYARMVAAVHGVLSRACSSRTVRQHMHAAAGQAGGNLSASAGESRAVQDVPASGVNGSCYATTTADTADCSSGSNSTSWIVVDADESQQQQPCSSGRSCGGASCSGCSSCGSSSGLFEQLVGRWSSRVLVLVQNVHFLPFGPSGTSPRTQGLLSAWRRVGGVLCVSHFVRRHVESWLPLELEAATGTATATAATATAAATAAVAGVPTTHIAPNAATATSTTMADRDAATAGTAAEARASDASGAEPVQHAPSCIMPPIAVVPLAAWSVFGSGPFPDFGAAFVRQQEALEAAAEPVHSCPLLLQPTAGAASRLSMQPCEPPAPSASPLADMAAAGREALSWSTPVHNGVGVLHVAGAVPHVPRPSVLPAPRALIGVLKLTPEKGSAIVLELARRLRQYDFLVVTGDPTMAGLARALPNIEVLEPQQGVDCILARCAIVLAPSIWLEAYGMVVTEAAMRGIPAIVSDAGGLPEAGMGACPVVAVRPIVVPIDASTGAPSWRLRQYPQQDVGPWQSAVEHLLVDRHAYAECSRTCRDAALQHVDSKGQYLKEFSTWLHFLASRS